MFTAMEYRQSGTFPARSGYFGAVEVQGFILCCDQRSIMTPLAHVSAEPLWSKACSIPIYLFWKSCRQSNRISAPDSPAPKVCGATLDGLGLSSASHILYDWIARTCSSAYS
ncbi:hypothetical protein P3342_011434 [Pyrenophora teres f. teres]|nr:hypothetical protein P3342_011434 [Pyrenophora teres f. teres]